MRLVPASGRPDAAASYAIGAYETEDIDMAVKSIMWCTLWVCPCCLLDHANGECCPDGLHGGDGIAPWATVDFSRFSVTMGLLADEHHEECEVRMTGDHNAVECDCERREFSTSQCYGCGSYLHGNRYAFTLWREPQRFATGSLPA